MTAPTFKPLVDFSLEAFDAEGLQQVFAISPFGASQTRAERVAGLEAAGILDPDCPTCRERYAHRTLTPLAPPHKGSPRCESGGHDHCSCSLCF